MDGVDQPNGIGGRDFEWLDVDREHAVGETAADEHLGVGDGPDSGFDPDPGLEQRGDDFERTVFAQVDGGGVGFGPVRNQRDAAGYARLDPGAGGHADRAAVAGADSGDHRVD